MAENENNQTTEIDSIRDLIDVCSMYSCKLCNFSSTNTLAIRSHVAETHSQSNIQAAKNDDSELTDSHSDNLKCQGSVDINVVVTPVEPSNVVGDVRSQDDEPVKLNFICSSCGAGFPGSEIIEHMVNVHRLKVEPLALRSDYQSSVTSSLSSAIAIGEITIQKNVISTGTQVELLKKRGRKRKIAHVDSPEQDFSVAELSDSKEHSETPIKTDVSESNSNKARATRMLEIDRLKEDVSNCFDLPKRSVRPPKTLVNDYHMIHQKHWKRQTTAMAMEQKFKCEVEGCGATFSSEKGHEYHAMCHTTGDESDSKFCCPECSTVFTTWIELRVHLLELHDIIVDQFFCDNCDFRAETASLLDEHNIAVHSSDAFADYEYTPRNSGIKRQRRPRNSVPKEGEEISTAEETECSQCQRKFADQKSMHRHVEIVHNKVKRFMCSLCGHSTAYKAMLQQHMRKHTGEKPYRCDLCLYTASDRNTLIRHRLRHGKQKPFPCSFCAYSYVREKSLKLHMESKHGDGDTANDDGSTSAVPKAAKVGRSRKTGVRAEKATKGAKMVPTVYACTVCRYQTVNKRSYLGHMATHGIDVASISNPQSQPVPTSDSTVAVTETYSVLSSLADAATTLQVFAEKSADVTTVTQAYSVVSA